jgi:hypothetical protein
MGVEPHNEPMDPIASIASQIRMRDSLTGAVADDPVVPEPTRRTRRRSIVHVTKRGIATTRRVGAVIALARGENDERPHVHMGPEGRPYVCEAPRCTSPSMSGRDL